MKRILVTGGSGMLGQHVLAVLKAKQIPFYAPKSSELDITSPKSIQNWQKKHKNNEISAVLHLAAYTAVDLAETEPQKCHQINVQGTKNLLEAVCKKKDVDFVFMSTDYVFDGSKNGEYAPQDKKNPLNVYGKSKSEAEDVVLDYEKGKIIRAGWLSGGPADFYTKIQKKIDEGVRVLRVVSDEIGRETPCGWLAEYLVDFLEDLEDQKAITHAISDESVASWYDLAQKYVKEKNLDVKVEKISAKELNREAKRPPKVVLGK